MCRTCRIPTGINNGVYNGTPIRLPYPGEAGERNNFRGDGYLDLDSGLAKIWGLGRYGHLQVHVGGLQHHQHQPV